MGWRRDELSAFGAEVAWLNRAASLTAFRRAQESISKSRYGLNEAVIAAIERLDVDQPGPEARQWLSERVGIGDDPLLLVFGEDDVCEVRTSFFLDSWQDLFCPSRDDVVILPAECGWVLFYSHEDEFEFVRGGPVQNRLAPAGMDE